MGWSHEPQCLSAEQARRQVRATLMDPIEQVREKRLGVILLK